MIIICHVMNTDIDAFWNLYTIKEFATIDKPDFMYSVEYQVIDASDIGAIVIDMVSTFKGQEVDNNLSEFFEPYLNFDV